MQAVCLPPAPIPSYRELCLCLSFTSRAVDPHEDVGLPGLPIPPSVCQTGCTSGSSPVPMKWFFTSRGSKPFLGSDHQPVGTEQIYGVVMLRM